MMMNMLILSVIIFTLAQGLIFDIECPYSQEESTKSIYMDGGTTGDVSGLPNSTYKLYIASNNSKVLIAIGFFCLERFPRNYDCTESGRIDVFNGTYAVTVIYLKLRNSTVVGRTYQITSSIIDVYNGAVFWNHTERIRIIE